MARWFAIAIFAAVGLILKTKYFVWAPTFDSIKILAMAAFAFSYNSAYWLYLRKPIEKVDNRWLAVVSMLQVLGDQLLYTVTFYFAGALESINFIFYFITILVASSLYGKKGIILTWLTSVILISGIVIAEYYQLMPHVFAFKGVALNPLITKARMISVPAYLGIAAIFSIVLSGLFRKREKGLREKSDQLSKQASILTNQTQELTRTKDYLHEALTKSDVARVEIEKTKDELQRANLELQAKIRELEKYGQVTTGRELKMMELKEKIRSMEERIKELEQQITHK